MKALEITDSWIDPKTGKIVVGKKWGIIRPGRPWSETLAQQVTGSSLLYGAIQLRALQGPEAEWYQVKALPGTGLVAKGMYTDAKAAMGAYAPVGLVAHILLASTNFLTSENEDEIRDWVVPSDRMRTNIERGARETIYRIFI